MLKIERVISVSSEDPSWPAENLLNEGKNKKWKCKSTGEKNATVVLQLEKSSKIKAIDVGNENSAFVEVLVGKSSLPDDNYKVLLVASSLMSLKEAKELTNSNGVRFFKESNLCKPECNEKWDRIKIVCSQPYNKHVQFGLSFIKLYSEDASAASSNTPVASSSTNSITGGLGKFLFKQDKDDIISVGSIFARRKELQQEEKTSAVAIRTATSEILNNSSNDSKTPNLHKKVTKKNSVSPGRDNNSEHVSTKTSQNSARKRENNKRAKPDLDLTDVPETKKVKKALPVNDFAGSSRQDQQLPPKNILSNLPSTSSKRRQFKPFNELMKDVIFTISGFQNPLRSDIRSKALAMGAKYKPDWDNACTHLICAFPNTPKFNQVKGHGKIIKKDWIEECYSNRKRFPWRRFALDPPDTKKPESEDEIFEETNESNNIDDEEAAVPNERLNNQVTKVRPAGPSLFGNTTMSSDPPNRNKPNKKPESKKELKPEPKKELKPEPKKELAKKSPKKKIVSPDKGNSSKAFSNSLEAGPARSILHLDLDLEEADEALNEDLADTESEHDWIDNTESDNTSDFPYLPEQFNDLSFYIADDFPMSVRSDLKRYIIAHSGTVLENCNQDTEYVIADKSSTIERLKERCPEIVGVKAEWVWRCHDENRLLPTSTFEL